MMKTVAMNIIDEIESLKKQVEFLKDDFQVSNYNKDIHEFCFKWIQINTETIDSLREMLKNI